MDEHLNRDEHLWIEAEARLSRGYDPESSRTAGLLASRRARWSSALVRLTDALASGLHDEQLLDALGESAYRAKALDILLQYAQHYRSPRIATHMARAYITLGDFKRGEEFLRLAQDSPLKTALTAIAGVKNNIEQAIKAMTDSCDQPASRERMRNLDYPAYWQALATISDAGDRADLVSYAEERTKALDYANPVIHYNQALRFLAANELRPGWNLYDWRLHPDSGCALPLERAGLPMWQGERLAGKTLLVYLEYGFGDQIFALRFVRAACLAGIEVEVVVGVELRRLVEQSFPRVTVHPAERVDEDDYWRERRKPHYWCYAFSLPARLSLWEPVHTPGYLRSTGDARGQLMKLKRKSLPVIGLVWHGDIRTAAMRTRAFTLTEFAREADLNDAPALLVNLQRDATAAEIDQLAGLARDTGGVFFDAAPQLQDFADTASWIRGVDRLISCDTAVAHLGGALHHPTTVMIRNPSIWQWIPRPESNRALWYDSVVIKEALVPKYPFMFDLRRDVDGA